MHHRAMKQYRTGSFFARLHQRTSLTLKMVILAVVVATVMWGGYDQIQTHELKKIFRAQLSERLSNQAMEDRIRFDRYVKAHLHSIKLFISQHNFTDYIDKRTWTSYDNSPVKKYRRPPQWFPSSSILRTFGQPRFALLFDSRGKLREAYEGPRNEGIPQSILFASRQLLLKSRGQNFMKNIDDKPYLIASELYVNAAGEEKATLMLASPIDDIFLSSALGSSRPGHIVALLTMENSPRILTSSNTDQISRGMYLKDLKQHYLVTGQEFLDYGAAEQAMKFVSFISLGEVNMLIKSIASRERKIRLIGLPIMVAAFALLMFWVTRRIQLITGHISEFSERALGVSSQDLKKGDQLYTLETRFYRLTEEVLQAREVQRQKAEEERLLEKKTMEIKQKEHELHLLQSVTEAVGVGVMQKTPQGLTAINRQMEHFSEMCGGLSSFEISDDLNQEHSLQDRHGSRRIFHITCPDIVKSEKIYLVRDITKIKEQTEALEHLAMHDILTDLPNRALLHDRLKQAIVTGQRDNRHVALLMMDLDRFKEINDTLGHHVGDMILKEVGERLPSALRKADTIARLGGDEFAVVLPSTQKTFAIEIAQKLLHALEMPFRIEGHDLCVGASIGVVLFPEDGVDAHSLMQRADVAMYNAKKTHSGVSLYNSEDDSHSMHHLMLMSELKRAIEQNELSLAYQPKISYRQGSIYGIEALVRWNHGEKGFISPGEFVPHAEYTGLIKPMTMWVLNTALRQYSAWRSDFDIQHINMSVNISAKNLLDLNFPDEVEEVLNQWSVDPSSLELEITESAVMEDPEHARKILEHLDALGVRLSIDDFGTGYTSLGYLKKLPVDEIKIDRSFVRHMTSDESDAMIVRSTVDLAHNLGMTVIAEGVETEEVLAALMDLGCDGAQGYYIGRPLFAAEFLQWLCESPWGLRSDSETGPVISLPPSAHQGRSTPFPQE